MTHKAPIYTIGHSTRTIDTFIDLLKHYHIKLLVDVRSYPCSKRCPQFDKENLVISLQNEQIAYLHLKELGGRRKALINSTNTSWHNASFRGYADYMQTERFKDAASLLIKTATSQATCIMCAEAVWWRCHRSMIADYLKSKNREVLHILSENKTEIHTYTQPAKIINGVLVYGPETDLFNPLL